MSVMQLLTYISVAATVIGWFVLVAALIALCWLAGMWVENQRYKIHRKRKHDREWDNLRSAWLFEQHASTVVDITDRIDTAEQVSAIDRIDTDVLHQTISEIEDYQKGHTSS